MQHYIRDTQYPMKGNMDEIKGSLKAVNGEGMHGYEYPNCRAPETPLSAYHRTLI